MGKVFASAGGEVVDAEHGVALAQQAVGEVRAEKSGGAGHKYAHGQRLILRSFEKSFAAKPRNGEPGSQIGRQGRKPADGRAKIV